MKLLLLRSVSDGSEEDKDSNDTQAVYFPQVAVALRLYSSATCSAHLLSVSREKTTDKGPLRCPPIQRLLLAQVCGTQSNSVPVAETGEFN